jgi:sensor histidine kinase YesM
MKPLQNVNISKKWMLAYACTGSFLLILNIVMLTFNHWGQPVFALKILDAITLWVLASMVLYVSLFLSIQWFRLPRKQQMVLLPLAYLVLSLISIAIHYPVWKFTGQLFIPAYVREEFIRNLFMFAISYAASYVYVHYKEKKALEQAYAQLKNEHLNSQVAALTNQINPHFFFNTLNTLSGLVRENPEKSEHFIDNFSLVFRYILDIQEKKTVPLNEELAFARNYVYLLKVRFEEKLQVQFHNTDNVHQQVPALCTQLLIENVIKHNKTSSLHPVHLHISVDSQYLIIANTYQPFANANVGGIGLNNLRQRCLLLCGKAIEIVQENNLFIVKVPLIN